MQKILLSAVLVLTCAGGVTGVRAQAPAGTATGGQTTPSKVFDDLLNSFEGECMAVAKAMPADKYSFSPAQLNIAGAKFAGVRTFAEEATHVAQANYYFYGAATGMKPDTDMKAIGSLKTKDEIVTALANSFAFAHKAIATLTMENTLDMIKPVDGQDSRGGVAGFAVAHGYDHYGQMVEYLRMVGIVPPGSK